jgi:predicted DCC family thiol-disulfide oxidoreductase YuxK
VSFPKVPLADCGFPGYAQAMSWVLFFDGDCAFCSRSVHWVARLDRRKRVAFAPLQGTLAAELGFAGYASEKGGTLVLLREGDGRVFKRSDALLELCAAFGGAWRLLRVLKCLPRPWRDRLYQWVADNRHRLMKSGDACRMPDPALEGRLRK